MCRISRQILIGALASILLGSGCGVIIRPSPTPVWTIPPAGPSVPPTLIHSAPATAAVASETPSIPITGEYVVSLQCQFCVEAEAHAILIFPDIAYFDVSTDFPVNCLTADVVNGRRILICHGTHSTTFELNICSDPENCLAFPVTLQSCPLLTEGTPMTTSTPSIPVFLSPVNTLKAPNNQPPRPPNTPAATSTPASPTSYP